MTTKRDARPGGPARGGFDLLRRPLRPRGLASRATCTSRTACTARCGLRCSSARPCTPGFWNSSRLGRVRFPRASSGVHVRQVIRVLKTPVTTDPPARHPRLRRRCGATSRSGHGGRCSETPCVMQDVGKELTPDKVTVRVLNGGEQGGHAKRTRTYLLAYRLLGDLLQQHRPKSGTTTTVVGHSADDPEVGWWRRCSTAPSPRATAASTTLVDVIVPTKYQECENPAEPSVAGRRASVPAGDHGFKCEPLDLCNADPVSLANEVNGGHPWLESAPPGHADSRKRYPQVIV